MTEDEVWCLLWRFDTNDVQVDRLETVLSTNRQAYRDNRRVDCWQPIYVGCKKAVEEACQAMRKTIEARRMAKATNIII